MHGFPHIHNQFAQRRNVAIFGSARRLSCFPLWNLLRAVAVGLAQQGTVSFQVQVAHDMNLCGRANVPIDVERCLGKQSFLTIDFVCCGDCTITLRAPYIAEASDVDGYGGKGCDQEWWVEEGEEGKEEEEKHVYRRNFDKRSLV